MRTLTLRRAAPSIGVVRAICTALRGPDRLAEDPTPATLSGRHRRSSIAVTPACSAPVLAAVAAAPTVVVQPGDTLTGDRRAARRLRSSRLVELNDLDRSEPDLRRAAAARRRTAARRRRRRAASTRRTSCTSSAAGRRCGASPRTTASPSRPSPRPTGSPNPAASSPASGSSIPGAAPPRRSRCHAAPAAAPPRAAPRQHGRARRRARRDAVGHRRATTASRVAAIAAANGLADPSRIFAGQRLLIPGGSARPAPARRRRRRGCRRRWPRVVAERDCGAPHHRARRPSRYGVPARVRAGRRLAGVGLAAGRRQPRRRGRRHAADAGDRRLGRRRRCSASRVDIHDARSNVARRRPAAGATTSTATAGTVDLVLAAYYQGSGGRPPRHLPGQPPVHRLDPAPRAALRRLTDLSRCPGSGAGASGRRSPARARR